MIRFLQQDSKLVKGVFIVFIAAAVGTMVITLVPGIFDSVNGSSADPNIYATVHETGLLGRVFGESLPVTQTEIQRLVQQQTQGRPVPAFLASYYESRVAPQVIQEKILKLEGDRLGLGVSDKDLLSVMHEGELGQTFFPGGKYIGDDKYIDFVQSIGYTRSGFEDYLKERIEISRLYSVVTGGVTVSDNEVRESYRVSGTKVKFDYAVISSADLAKSVNPSDSDLQAFFKQNAGRYATAVPESRKIQYLSFGIDQIPGGKPTVTDADLQAYYNAHQDAYAVKEQVKARHILITAPKDADAKTDAAAKAKAEGILKQLRAGGDFAALAKANSDDPGSKDSGGELGFFGKGRMVPPFEKAAFALQPGQTSDLVRSDFGYHIINVEQHDMPHQKPLAEVKGDIQPLLEQQKLGQAEQAYATQLAAQAKSQGIEKTAAAHNLTAQTTDYLGRDGTIAGVSDGAAMLTQAFAAAKDAAPAAVSTGDGFAVFQVTDIKAPHAPTFDEYKSHLLADYRDQQVPQMLAAQIKKLDDLAKQLGDLHKAAAQMNVPVKSSDLVGKDGQVPDVGAMSGPAAVAFSLPKGGISGPLNTGPNGVVLAVTDKQEPSTDDIAKNFTQTRNQMLNQKREEVFEIYVGTLEGKYEKAGAIRQKVKPAQPGLPLGS
jgi:peptidyl-prolyl cis-trans isomerase D